MALIAIDPCDPPIMKTSGVSAGNPNRTFAPDRAVAQSDSETTDACATSERSGRPASRASENFPLATGCATAR